MTNNTTLTEIAALVLAVLLMIAGTVLLYIGKIGYDNAIFFFISALGLFGFNSAWKAPSPAQQSQLMSLIAQSTIQPPVVINNNIPPAPVTLVAPPAPVGPTTSQFKNAATTIPEFTAPLEVVKP